MSSLSKMLSILELFELQRPMLSADQVQSDLGLTRTTAYRYLKTLVDAGLLSRFAGNYVIGPKAIELDYILQSTDPLIQRCERPLMRVSAKFHCDLQLVGLSGGHIVVLKHVRTDQGLTVSFGRGRRMPFFRGAGAKVLISYLPDRVRRPMLAAEHTRADISLGPADISQEMKVIRRQGYYCSQGELDPETVGIAMPVAHPALDMVAALVMVVSRQRFAEAGLDDLLPILKKAHKGVIDALHDAPED